MIWMALLFFAGLAGMLICEAEAVCLTETQKEIEKMRKFLADCGVGRDCDQELS